MSHKIDKPTHRQAVAADQITSTFSGNNKLKKLFLKMVALGNGAIISHHDKDTERVHPADTTALYYVVNTSPLIISESSVQSLQEAEDNAPKSSNDSTYELRNECRTVLSEC